MAVIGLNTIAFDNLNLYLLGDQTFAILQLFILEQELKAHDHVYLCGHIPPTMDQTAPEYSQVFRALVDRYSAKIVNQFYGHTHSDQLLVNTDPQEPSIVTGWSLVAPSVTPLGSGRPKYRVYRVLLEEGNQGVTDYTQFALNDLTDQKTPWTLDYRFSQKYKIIGDQPITK